MKDWFVSALEIVGIINHKKQMMEQVLHIQLNMYNICMSNINCMHVDLIENRYTTVIILINARNKIL